VTHQETSPQVELEARRRQLRRIDGQLFDLLEERIGMAREIMAWKKEIGLPMVDLDRERYLIAMARQNGDAVARIMELVIAVGKEGHNGQ
jgi:chorismate mutase